MDNLIRQIQSVDKSRLAGQVSGNAPKPAPKSKPDASSDDAEQFLGVRKLRIQYTDYLTNKVNEIEEQKNARRYYHCAQYTDTQLKILRRRHQPPLTWNRVSRKINGIVGLTERVRSDPKALPRSLKSEQGANLATEVIRSVLGSADWKGIEPSCLLQSSIEGIAGVQEILVKGDEQDPDIEIEEVIGDEYFYDTKSYRTDFRDIRFEGISKWIDIDEAIGLFPDKEDVLKGLVDSDSEMSTYPDREINWVITATQQVRLVEHWYRHRGNWCWAFYVKDVILDEGLSPFFDEKGKRRSSFHMFSVAIDQDGDRYGFVRNLQGPQDSLNQSKSKALHIANSRRLVGEKGAVDDVEKTRLEWARPDGYVEVNPGRTLKPDDQSQDLAAFIKFGDDAKNEIDQFASTNIGIVNGAAINNISGRAIELLRQPGMAELGPFILAIRKWKLNLYRGIWGTAQRYWKSERWIRFVDSDEDKAKFLKINGLGLDQFGRPALVNALGSLDVDIELEEGPDVASVMQDTYDALKGYPPGTFPPQVLIEMSSMSRADKNRFLKMMSPPPPPPDPHTEIAKKLALEGAAIKNAKTAAEARKTDASVDQVRADAEAKRAKAGESVARSGHLASQSHLDAAEFVRDTYREAHEIIHGQSGEPAAQPPSEGMP